MGRVLARAVGVLTAGVVLSGCWWPQVGHSPARQRWNWAEDGLTVANVASLQQAWTVAVPHLPTLSGASNDLPEPIVTDGKVFVPTSYFTPETGPPPAGQGTVTSGLAAYDLSTGSPAIGGSSFATLRTTTTVGGSALEVGPTMLGDELWQLYVLFVAPEPGNNALGTALVDPATGTTRTSPLASIPLAAPAELGGIVVLPHDSGILAYDRETEATLWTAPWGTTPDLFDARGAQPAIGGGRVFVHDNVALQAYGLAGCGDPSCTPLWSYDMSDGHTAAQPAVADSGQVLVVAGPAESSRLVSLDGATGAVSWTADLGADPDTQPLAITDDTVYVSTGGATPKLRAYAVSGCDTPLCAPLWEAPLGAAGPLVVAGGVVYAGDGSTVRAFDAAGCGAAVCTDALTTLGLPGLAEHVIVADGHVVVRTRGVGAGLTVFAVPSGG